MKLVLHDSGAAPAAVSLTATSRYHWFFYDREGDVSWMTVSQNTDLFVLGLVPRGVVFAGKAMCALIAPWFSWLSFAPRNGFYRLSLGESMDEQFTQAHAQCMTHPKKPAGQPLADNASAKRCMASFFNGVRAKPIPLRFLRNLWRASAPADAQAMTLARMGAAALIHTL